MKLAVCGKGGSGKSTLTSLLGKELARMGKSVLIVDSDESNYGLHRQLGLALPTDFTGYFGGKEKVLGDMMLSNFTHQFFTSTWSIKDIPEGYCAEEDGVKLMASGKIHTANEGCACAMGTVIGQFVANLELGENEFAIMDMEAGIEHFGRGIDNGMDAVLMIIDPSFESLKLSKKVAELGDSINKPVYYVLNKVNDSNADLMMRNIEDKDAVICQISEDMEIASAGLQGNPLNMQIEEIKLLAQKLTEMK